MAGLFSPGRIGTLELQNRFVRTASHEGLATEEGDPTEFQFRFYRRFVDGGVGLVITGYAGIAQRGKSALRHMTMIDDDARIPAHRRLCDGIHAAGGKIVLQIAHCGRQTWSRDTHDPPLVGPSAIPCGFYKEMPHALAEDEIETVVGQFATAAERAKRAGYDGVQIHGAHGYLLSTFLASHANHRTDAWGGSLENKFRIVARVLRAVRAAVGPGFPVLIKLNSFEKPSDGMKPEECAKVAKLVEAIDCCDAIEVSAGTNEDGFYMARGGLPIDAILKYLRPYRDMNGLWKLVLRTIAKPFLEMAQPPFREGYNLEASALVKKAVSLPVITVGGMRTKSFMESAIAEGKTDFVSMARPLLLEPDLANRFRTGRSRKARCDNCNACVVAVDAVPINCYNTKLNPRMDTSYMPS